MPSDTGAAPAGARRRYGSRVQPTHPEPRLRAEERADALGFRFDLGSLAGAEAPGRLDRDLDLLSALGAPPEAGDNPVDEQCRHARDALEAAPRMRLQPLAHLCRHELPALAETHHVAVVLGQQAQRPRSAVWLRW